MKQSNKSDAFKTKFLDSNNIFPTLTVINLFTATVYSLKDILKLKEHIKGTLSPIELRPGQE